MKCIVAGSRSFKSYTELKLVLDSFFTLENNIEIVSGGATGADKLGEQYAKEKGYGLKVFPADWNKHGKSAGPIRNEAMAKYADACIVFWDGKSKGTSSMIKLAEKYNLKLIIEQFKP